MATITSNYPKVNSRLEIKHSKKSLWVSYLEYAASKDEEYVLSYLKVIMVIPTLTMVIPIIAMSMLTPNYIWFVALAMLLFFANVIAHIAQTKSIVHIPLYHATNLVLFLIPVLTYLLT